MSRALLARWWRVGHRSLSRGAAARLAVLGPVGPPLTARRPRGVSCSQEGLGGELGFQIADHAAVDDIREVAFEDPASLLLGVTAGSRLGVDRLSARFAAQLGDRHQVQDPVDPSVAARVVAMADRFAGSLRGRGRQRR